ncbi:MAG TPA: hypothetical protein VJS20_11610 [Gemmatimonadales bacterium]|nr:hypothetical protein [Gemmatimonadales bacterium]
MALLKQSTAYVRTFLMVQSSDHLTGITGATVTVKLGKAGGTGATAGGAVAEIDSTNLPGWYKVSLNTTDTNTVGDLTYHCTATSADPTDFTDQVVVVDLATAIETQVWDALRASHQVAGSFGLSNQLVDDGTAGAGAATTITLTGKSATDNFYKGDLIYIYGGTGAQQPPNPVASYVGSTKVATMQNTWTVTPDNTSKYVIIPSPFVIDPWDEARSNHTTSGSFGEGVASVQGNVTGNVAGTVGAAASVTGNVGGNVAGSVNSVTTGVTVTTNNDKTGYALTSGERTSIADAQLDEANGVETSLTMRQALRLIAAVSGGKTNGMNTTTAHVRDVNDTANRVTATLDGNGNRTAVTLSL